MCLFIFVPSSISNLLILQEVCFFPIHRPSSLTFVFQPTYKTSQSIICYKPSVKKNSSGQPKPNKASNIHLCYNMHALIYDLDFKYYVFDSHAMNISVRILWETRPIKNENKRFMPYTKYIFHKLLIFAAWRHHQWYCIGRFPQLDQFKIKQTAST